MPHRFRREGDVFIVESGDIRLTTPWFMLTSPPNAVARKLGRDAYQIAYLDENRLENGVGTNFRAQGVVSRRYMGRVVPAPPEMHERAEAIRRRPRSSWETPAEPFAPSPLAGLLKLDPPIVVTPKAKAKARKRLEKATKPYRQGQRR